MKASDLGKVAVLMGGRSAERAVSLKSGAMVLAALKKKGVDAHSFDLKEKGLDAFINGRYDRAFIALHGRYGEDGTIQGALELIGVPYTGSGVLASALAMDKWRAKLVWEASGIPTPRCELLEGPGEFQAVATRLGLPLMVKPANEGSSIGMTKVKSARELPEAYALAANYDRSVIAERFVDGVELTVAILGDTPLPTIKLETPREFYDYEAKYTAQDTRYIIPCGLPPDAERIVQGEALRAFRTLDCRGWGRVDLILDRSGKPYFLEVNTSPGMTDHSLVPMAARHAGGSAAAQPDLSVSNEGTVLGPLGSDDGGFMVNWTFAYGNYRADEKVLDDLGWARYPQTVPGEESRPPIGGINVGISRFAGHQDLAAKALECITSEEQQVTYAIETANMPARAAAYEDATLRKEFPADLLELWRSSIDSGGPRPASAYWATIVNATLSRWHPASSVNPDTTPEASAEFIEQALQGKVLL